jgi:hypothetical protein
MELENHLKMIPIEQRNQQNKLFQSILNRKVENAKQAVVSFVKEFTAETNDSIQIVGFSTKVDIVSKFSNNRSYLDSITNSISVESNTAYFDAINVALEELKNRDGINIIVALTDGLDNSSQITAKQVAKKAKRLKVPIYNIGLGYVNTLVLQQISNESNGVLYYTKQSNALQDIYQQIQKRIASIYDVRYISRNLSSIDTNRIIRIEFEIDSIYAQNNITYLNLSKETIQYIKAKERKRRQRFALFVVFGVAVGAGILIYRYRRRKHKRIPRKFRV